MREISCKLNMSYYLKHTDEYREHKEIIRRINELLMQDDCEILTANERSYLIFGDEKAITAPKDASIDGESILNRLGLTIEHIKAERKLEPFFYIKVDEYNSLRDVSARTILIVENKDTFWTFMDATLSRELADIHLLIYGEGNAVVSKFEFIQIVGGKTTDRYYYFGDMDQEGILIFNQLRSTFTEYDIRPAVSLYEYMLNKAGPENAKPLRKYRKTNKESLSPLIDFFNHKTRKVIEEIISAQKYIPQEVVNKTDMRRLSTIGIC
ncbi:Wadjet anti-phage system protein JetD domain-containing protein [Methanosarcina sp. UBA411]|uniref:Wadjet anti-phage system protein JetD domain-containing protein n=1 Tax=Methanosarcina sp. UBA411 TaxID=1915589 RepID=UPI0025D7EBD2|nr:Wadjet anti-phage system protein JetD domain-containing protein [Methanosarcina sp. UBA411]